MSAYTVSQLAHDAGVSVHVVRDDLLRGLVRPVACTTGGYGVFDVAALQRLCVVRAAFEAGIGLDAVARLCRALDAADSDQAAAQLASLRQFVRHRREALAELDTQLTAMPIGVFLPGEPREKGEVAVEQIQAREHQQGTAGQLEGAAEPSERFHLLDPFQRDRRQGQGDRAADGETGQHGRAEQRRAAGRRRP